MHEAFHTTRALGTDLKCINSAWYLDFYHCVCSIEGRKCPWCNGACREDDKFTIYIHKKVEVLSSKIFLFIYCICMMHSFGTSWFLCERVYLQESRNLAQIYPQTVPPTLQLTQLAEHMPCWHAHEWSWVGFEALQSNHFLPKILITERKKKC